MKKALYWLLVIIFGCSTPPVSPGITFLQSLNQYRAEIEQLENRPERWPDRQKIGEWLKTEYRYTIGKSREFDRLIDLDFKRRELVTALTDLSSKPERTIEIKEELANIEKEVSALIEPIRAQIGNAELRAPQPPQRIEAIAAIGLLTLGIDAFSSAGSPSHAGPASITVGGRFVLTDHGSFSTVRTPEGQTYRCFAIPLRDGAASIKCDQIGK